MGFPQQLLPELSDADLYSQHGQPGQPPFRLALAPVLRFIEGLLDRGAADAVRGRIDWKYLLRLELDDPGFDHSVFCEFRARLLEGGAERILFDKILSALRDKKLAESRIMVVEGTVLLRPSEDLPPSSPRI